MLTLVLESWKSTDGGPAGRLRFFLLVTIINQVKKKKKNGSILYIENRLIRASWLEEDLVLGRAIHRLGDLCLAPL